MMTEFKHTFRLAEGRYYLRRDGRVIGPAHLEEGYGCLKSYTALGTTYNNMYIFPQKNKSPVDIIAEVPAPGFTVQAGKYYRRRDGLHIGPLDGKLAWGEFRYVRDGRCLSHFVQGWSPYDLLEAVPHIADFITEPGTFYQLSEEEWGKAIRQREFDSGRIERLRGERDKFLAEKAQYEKEASQKIKELQATIDKLQRENEELREFSSNLVQERRIVNSRLSDLEARGIEPTKKESSLESLASYLSKKLKDADTEKESTSESLTVHFSRKLADAERDAATKIAAYRTCASELILKNKLLQKRIDELERKEPNTFCKAVGCWQRQV